MKCFQIVNLKAGIKKNDSVTQICGLFRKHSEEDACEVLKEMQAVIL